MSPRVCAGGLAVAVALAPAGCGGGGGGGGEQRMSKSAYERAFKATLARYKKRARPILRAERRGRTLRERARGFERIRQLVLRTDAELARLRPPAEVSAAHAAIVNGVRAYVNGPAKRASAAFRRGDFKRGNAILDDEAQVPIGDTAGADQGAAELRARGYHVGPVEDFLP